MASEPIEFKLYQELKTVLKFTQVSIIYDYKFKTTDISNVHHMDVSFIDKLINAHIKSNEKFGARRSMINVLFPIEYDLYLALKDALSHTNVDVTYIIPTKQILIINTIDRTELEKYITDLIRVNLDKGANRGMFKVEDSIKFKLKRSEFYEKSNEQKLHESYKDMIRISLEQLFLNICKYTVDRNGKDTIMIEEILISDNYFNIIYPGQTVHNGNQSLGICLEQIKTRLFDQYSIYMVFERRINRYAISLVWGEIGLPASIEINEESRNTKLKHYNLNGIATTTATAIKNDQKLVEHFENSLSLKPTIDLYDFDEKKDDEDDDIIDLR